MKSILKLFVVMLTFVACKRQDLVYDYESTTRVTVHVDWGDIFTPNERPTGVSVWFYPSEGKKPIKKLSSNIDSVQVYLPAGRYDVVVFNQAPSDFRDEIDFVGTDKLSTLEVRASLAPSKSWFANKDLGKVYVCPPVFATEVYRDLIISEVDAESKKELSIIVAPKKITKSARIIVRMSGIDYVRSGRGVVSNMSQGYLIGKEEYSTVSRSMLENWDTRSTQNDGEMFVYFNTFGIHNIQDSESWNSKLQLQMLLVDNQTIKNLSLPIDDNHLVDTDEELDIEIDINTIIIVPPVEPDGGSGFDPSVDDWGDEDNVEM